MRSGSRIVFGMQYFGSGLGATDLYSPLYATVLQRTLHISRSSIF